MSTPPRALARARRWTAGTMLAATLTVGGISYQLAGAETAATTTTTTTTTSGSSSASDGTGAASSSSDGTNALESTNESAQTTTSGS
jgi:hypothetical protein